MYMNKIEAKGLYVILETTKAKPADSSGLVLDSEIDSSNRYIEGKVVSGGEQTGLKGGETILYDKKNVFGTRIHGKLYKVCLVHNIIAVL